MSIDPELIQKAADLLWEADVTSTPIAPIRDLLGTTRKFAVPLCEYLDRVGVTRRDGDLRLLAT